MTRPTAPGGAIDAGAIKTRVRAFLNRTPCGTGGSPHPPDSAHYYKWIERERDARGWLASIGQGQPIGD